jgi:hypothetical protein
MLLNLPFLMHSAAVYEKSPREILSDFAGAIICLWLGSRKSEDRAAVLFSTGYANVRSAFHNDLQLSLSAGRFCKRGGGTPVNMYSSRVAGIGYDQNGIARKSAPKNLLQNVLVKFQVSDRHFAKTHPVRKFHIYSPVYAYAHDTAHSERVKSQ